METTFCDEVIVFGSKDGAGNQFSVIYRWHVSVDLKAEESKKEIWT
jgi:hypothetical protein